MRRCVSFARREDGAALAEFAIVLPLLMLILFSILGWGYSLSLLDAMYDTARQTAREISVGEITTAQAQAFARADLAGWSWQTSGGRDFTVVATEIVNADSTDVSVQITADNNFADTLAFIPVVPPLDAVVIMRKEEF